MSELLTAINDGTLNSGNARDLEDKGANLRQGLAYAMSTGRTAAVLEFAHGCAVRLSSDDAPAKSEEILEKASADDWAFVAYHAALAADADSDELEQLMDATDPHVRKELRKAAGGFRVQLPRDLRLKYARRGKMSPVLLVDRPRWLLPRPRKDELFLLKDGSQLPDGWYSLLEYPLGDDLKEAFLRRTDWGAGPRRDAAARILRRQGETLLCKAAKAGQWALVSWLVERQGTDAAVVRLAAQLTDEFSNLWNGIQRTALLRGHEDLVELCDCLDDDNELRRAWRLGALVVPAGARMRSPRMAMLKDALALGPLSMQGLRLVGGTKVVFDLDQMPEAKSAWRADLAACGEESFARPLLHRAAEAGQAELVQSLLKAMVDIESRDARGLTAVAVAASSRRFEVVGILLDEGCRLDGASGSLAMAAAQRFARPGQGLTEEEVEEWSSIVQRLCDRRCRAPAAGLEDYFRRQARGEIVHGTEPRRYEMRESELRLRGASLRVSARLLVLDGAGEQEFDVCFVSLDHSKYTAIVDAGIADVSRHKLYTEQALINLKLPMAVPLAVPRGRLSAAGGPEGSLIVKTDGVGAYAASMPLIARALSSGSLRVESLSCCCKAAVGGVEIIIDGVRVGETPKPDPVTRMADDFTLVVPQRDLVVVAEHTGRKLVTEKIAGGPDAEITVMASLAIYIYVQMVDEETRMEFVYVCGHRRDVPSDSRPFVGTVVWDGGSVELSSHSEALAMQANSDMECLTRMQSMRLTPVLQAGRRFEAVEWEDTQACQYERVLVNPVRVGNITDA